MYYRPSSTPLLRLIDTPAAGSSAVGAIHILSSSIISICDTTTNMDLVGEVVVGERVMGDGLMDVGC